MRTIHVDFSGTAWPAVRIVKRETWTEPPQDSGGRPKSVSVAELAVSGNGRKWTASRPRGFWRTFGNLDFENDAEIVDFIKRYRHPDSALSPKQTVYTYQWRKLILLLYSFNIAWQSPDEDGISRVGPTGQLIVTDVQGFNERYLKRIPPHDRCERRDGILLREASGVYGGVGNADVAGGDCDASLRHLWPLVRSTAPTAKVCSASCRNIQSKRGSRKECRTFVSAGTQTAAIFFQACWHISVEWQAEAVD